MLNLNMRSRLIHLYTPVLSRNKKLDYRKTTKSMKFDAYHKKRILSCIPKVGGNAEAFYRMSCSLFDKTELLPRAYESID